MFFVSTIILLSRQSLKFYWKELYILDSLQSIICGIIASFIFKWIETVFFKNSPNETNIVNSTYKLSAIKKEFYAFAPLGIIGLLIYSNIEHGTFISCFIMFCSTIFLIFALFAFMCCVELVNKLTSTNTNANKKDITDDTH